MKPKLAKGDRFIMNAVSGDSDSEETIVVELDERGAVVVWPRPFDFFEQFNQISDENLVEPLFLKSRGGWLTLQEGVAIGGSASSIGYLERRFRYFRAISTGARRVDYSAVNGMSSTVDGLARWTKHIPVEQRLIFDGSSKSIDGLIIAAKNLDPLLIGGPLNMKLTTSYSHSPKPKGGVYQIPTMLNVRTLSQDALDWDLHAREHRMIQDLMCLVYGRACFSYIDSVMREDDQEFEPEGERRSWRDAYEPSFGRSARGAEPLVDDDKPLFYFGDTDPKKVAAWLNSYELWSRPTWIGVTPLFHTDLPVESQVLHAAVALESLGAAIAKRDSISLPNCFEGLLKIVFGSLGFIPEQVVGKSSVSEWCKKFNSAYKGAKHADNPLPDPLDAYHRAQEGLTLIRCWLGIELGVSSEVLIENMKYSR